MKAKIVIYLFTASLICSLFILQTGCKKEETNEPDPGNSVPTSITYEGQTYNIIQVGSQYWFKENLNVGTMIDGGTNQTDNGQIEKYCYDNDAANCATYGGLYQWDEMMQYSTQPGTQGICPTGWHIPTHVEWLVLTNFLGGESVAGGKLKETDTLHWNSPNTGANNQTGFTALPAGWRFDNGSFGYIGEIAVWWNSTEYSDSTSWDRYLVNNTGLVNAEYSGKEDGFSVRCIKDDNGITPFTVSTVAISNITETTATSGGSVTAQSNADVVERGVCWSTSPNPTLEDSHTSDNMGTGSFTSVLTGLIPATSYYVRAYASDTLGTIFGNKVEFTTLGGENPPVADFTASTNSGTAPLSVEFTDLSTNNPESWQWDFGDGGASTQQNPSHTYNEAGNYTVQLIVSNGSSSDTMIKDNYITVTGGGPGDPCSGIQTVTYEGETYNTVEIGDQCWFKENLNVGTMINGEIGQTNNGEVEKYCYDNDPANCDEYGGLYQWDETMQYTTLEGAQGICPVGWHIPTYEDWDLLTDFLGGQDFAGGTMKEVGTLHWLAPNTGATNESGFTALGGGAHDEINGFYHIGHYCRLWSSYEWTESEAGDRHMNNSYIECLQWITPKINSLSVRCIKDN